MFEQTKSFWQRLLGKGPKSASQRDDERRLWVRYPANLTTNLAPTSNGSPVRLSSQIRNISRGGVNLLVDHAFEAGDHVTLELPLENEQLQSVLACVVHAVEEKPGSWALGCVFSHELADEDLIGLGAKRVKYESSDNRTWVRYSTNVHARFQSVAEGHNLAHDAKVLNVSASGVGLQVVNRIEPGVLLSVDFLDDAQVVRQTMLACVVHVSPCEGNEWALGCNFIRQLSEHDLKSLV